MRHFSIVEESCHKLGPLGGPSDSNNVVLTRQKFLAVVLIFLQGGRGGTTPPPGAMPCSCRPIPRKFQIGLSSNKRVELGRFSYINTTAKTPPRMNRGGVLNFAFCQRALISYLSASESPGRGCVVFATSNTGFSKRRAVRSTLRPLSRPHTVDETDTDNTV